MTKAPQIRAVGRVLAVDARGAWLWRQGQARHVVLAEPAAVGQHVINRGDGWRLLGPAPAQLAQPDGDFWRFSEREGTRWWATLARAKILQTIRKFFDDRGFVEVDPPAVAQSPGLELHLDAVRAELREGMGGATTTRYLVTSPEYHCKRLLSAGFERIYSLQHAFRSGERGCHHNPEFMMLEWYRAGAEYREIVADCRALAVRCGRALCHPSLQSVATLPGRRPPVDLRRPWKILTIRQAIRRFAGFDPGDCRDEAMVRQRAAASGLGVSPGDQVADVLIRALVERVEPALAGLPGVVLERWPVSMASLARPFPDDARWAERFEIYLDGVELANGFTELTDPDEQLARFEQDLSRRRTAGLPEYPIDQRFMTALREGCPASAGVALGVDRLLMALTGLRDIDDVLAFPFERA